MVQYTKFYLFELVHIRITHRYCLEKSQFNLGIRYLYKSRVHYTCSLVTIIIIFKLKISKISFSLTSISICMVPINFIPRVHGKKGVRRFSSFSRNRNSVGQTGYHFHICDNLVKLVNLF